MNEQCELLCLNLDVAEDLRGRAKSTDAFRNTAKLHSALSDELRLAMLASLTEHELCGCDLAWIHERSQSLVSHHMKMLVEAGLVTSRRDGRIVFFSLTEAGKNHASTFVEQARV